MTYQGAPASDKESVQALFSQHIHRECLLTLLSYHHVASVGTVHLVHHIGEQIITLGRNQLCVIQFASLPLTTLISCGSPWLLGWEL